MMDGDFFSPFPPIPIHRMRNETRPIGSLPTTTKFIPPFIIMSHFVPAGM
jgi:hypothetical protein